MRTLQIEEYFGGLKPVANGQRISERGLAD